jgi:hypothetical protein
MYGFCRITDLGKSHFNFSSKNCSSKVYTCFAKVVVLVTQSTAKLGLQFLDFSTILYRIYKLQLKTLKGVRFISRTDPCKVLGVHSYALGLHKTPQKEVRPCNAALGSLGRRGSPDSGEAGGGDGRGSGWRGSRVHEGSICVLTRGGERTGGRARRRPATAAAGSSAPVN